MTSSHAEELRALLRSRETSSGADLKPTLSRLASEVKERVERGPSNSCRARGCEWWNGGYPAKLRRKRIPIHARIVALADVFDALTHGRPFARPWSVESALGEIRSRRGIQFDPEITDRFLALVENLVREHSDLDAYLGKAGRNSPFLQARAKIRQLLSEKRDGEQKATVPGNETRH